MPARLTLSMAAALACYALLALAARAQEPATAGGSPSGRATFSGVYPHLAVTNGGGNETGIGAVVPWAGKLWFVTYPAHVFKGGNDKLCELDAGLNLVARPESVGGTHASRMIHRESNQLIIGPYFIDAKGAVRAVSQTIMPGRHTATARHLKDPANKVYFATMEQGFYEVDVRTLEVKELHKDRNVGGKNMLPGVHGKGSYTGQGRLVYANNGSPRRPSWPSGTAPRTSGRSTPGPSSTATSTPTSRGRAASTGRPTMPRPCGPSGGMPSLRSWPSATPASGPASGRRGDTPTTAGSPSGSPRRPGTS